MPKDQFVNRHIGPDPHETEEMLRQIGVNSLDELIKKTVPESILVRDVPGIGKPMSEYDYLHHIRQIGNQNKIFKSFIGMGFYGTVTPSVIKRNILENPSWYTSYTPYQAEISQGRLEALLNFQTMVMSLTGMDIANASLLDESTAAAEAMIMMFNLRSRQAIKEEKNAFFVDENIFPQTLSVLKTRALPLNIEIVHGNYIDFNQGAKKYFGAIIQYPGSDGKISDYTEFVSVCHSNEILVGAIADIMSLVLLIPPGEWGADIVVGSTQRFGIPLGFGGPHAAFFATREQFKRNIPGRIIGVSIDRHNNPALRMALQTREQHIKRERATSNICTAQALLATMASMYAIYHGPEGLREIAETIHSGARLLDREIEKLGYTIQNRDYFDTLKVILPAQTSVEELKSELLKRKINVRYFEDGTVGISTDETIRLNDINSILTAFAKVAGKTYTSLEDFPVEVSINRKFLRETRILSEKIFNSIRSETDLMRYMKYLERKDISLTHSMISLGSCTMKLNAASELMAFLWPEFSDIHPFVPSEQAKGYYQLFNELAEDLLKITGFSAISFQPNSGAAGEYTGLMVIREYHKSRGQGGRNVVLIPSSAHGTNPASAVMAGMEVVVVPCDANGNIDVRSLSDLAERHRENLAAFMITYPSTHGVFEKEVKEMIRIVHENGGQVYMDGANMNAQVGLTSPAFIGADVCHLNLHKTFAIPHGGGGPGVGPIAVAPHLSAYLPGHPVIPTGGMHPIDAVSAAPYGSASILTISHAYIKMLGDEGLARSTKIAILNANYMASVLDQYYPVLYRGEEGMVGHEMILDCRGFKAETGISEADIAKRLMDYGFHAPTLSFPVHGTLMVEPTESESKQELDRFIEAMKSIFNEIEEIKKGQSDNSDNVLKNAPHTLTECTGNLWQHSYDRETAAFPAGWLKYNKFWPAVARVDDAHGDRNLVCTCQPVESYMNES